MELVPHVHQEPKPLSMVMDAQVVVKMKNLLTVPVLA